MRAMHLDDPIIRRTYDREGALMPTPDIATPLRAPVHSASAAPDNVGGGLWALAAVVAATFMAIGVREASAGMDTRMVVLLRSAMILAVLLAMLPFMRGKLRFSRPGLHLLRGAMMGLSISWIFAVFTGISITQTFLVTSISFAGLSLWGYTTKKDISGWGSFLIMGVIGLIVASIVNIFVGSGPLMMAINVIGVLIFAGLTAYDTQRLKNDYMGMAQGGAGAETIGKSAIMGALSLYINFLNMFMMLLSLFGNRN
jgi:FtsH-binding integral membrane protein